MKKTILIVLLALPVFVNAQNCDCEKNFNWAKETFEQNDAGFTYAIEKKGRETYEQHNYLFEQKVKNIEDINVCVQTIYEWMKFFRSGHIGVQVMFNPNDETNENTQSEQDIIEKFKDWEKIEINVKEFKEYLDTKKEKDFEGIWISEPYEIGIKKVEDKYLGFIIKADGIYWREGQIKFKIDSSNSSTFYMKNHFPQNFEQTVLIGEDLIEMGFILLSRKYPEIKKEKADIARYIKTMEADSPYFEKVNENTTLLRIPSFAWQQKQKIDSVISANKESILQTPNLIIDIRNNGGGSDESFEELLPLVYTNPIRTIGVELLSTPLNNQRMLDIINEKYGKVDDKEKRRYQEYYDKLEQHIGEFVMLNEYPVTITTYDTIYPNPQNIGIIINEFNGSTTEQFLLAAKQSKKVKLFGTTTAGILDISNMYFVPSPCNQFGLAYCISKSKRIPEMAIDGKGIQPDYYIDKDILKYQWTDFVIKVLNKK